jgi:hypothetical protein
MGIWFRTARSGEGVCCRGVGIWFKTVGEGEGIFCCSVVLGRGKSGGKKKRGGEAAPGVVGRLEVFSVEDIIGTGVRRGLGIAGVGGVRVSGSTS